jgi:hypothetical protein
MSAEVLIQRLIICVDSADYDQDGKSRKVKRYFTSDHYTYLFKQAVITAPSTG